MQPFYTDFGKNIRVGRNVFVNHACEFMDRGGITIGDDVLIGPKVNLVTINHLDPAQRRSTWCAPIVIKRGAWLGASVSVMPGVTDHWRECGGDGNAVVIRDVLDNTVVGGIPARVIKNF